MALYGIEKAAKERALRSWAETLQKVLEAGFARQFWLSRRREQNSFRKIIAKKRKFVIKWKKMVSPDEIKV